MEENLKIIIDNFCQDGSCKEAQWVLTFTYHFHRRNEILFAHSAQQKKTVDSQYAMNCNETLEKINICYHNTYFYSDYFYSSVLVMGSSEPSVKLGLNYITFATKITRRMYNFKANSYILYRVSNSKMLYNKRSNRVFNLISFGSIEAFLFNALRVFSQCRIKINVETKFYTIISEIQSSQLHGKQSRKASVRK